MQERLGTGGVTHSVHSAGGDADFPVMAGQRQPLHSLAHG